MQRLVVDPLTGDRVILAPARALRPDTFRVHADAQPERVDTCPFCPGNEHETPPEVARLGAGAPDTPGWTLRVVPNKYPIVGDGVAGAHEVVILSPAHDADLGALDAVAASDVFLALRDRARVHLGADCAFAQAFVNFGKAAGASIEHPHAQLIALAAVPPRVQTRLDHFRDDAFVADREHLVLDGDATVWCPRAPTSAFAMRVACPTAGPTFDGAPDDEIRAVSTAVRSALRALHAVVGGVPYNLVVESAPRTHEGAFRWWVDVLPRITVTAGFEAGTGLFVNVVEPADAAAALGAAVER